MVNRRWLALGLAILASSLSLRAQDVEVTARVDSNHILIGDWLKVTLDIQHKPNATVFAPALPDSLEGFVVVRRDSPQVKQSTEAVLESRSYIVTCFDSGMHVFPPIDVQYKLSDNQAVQTARSAPVVVMVQGIKVDTSQAIKDVKPPLSIPLTFAELLPYLIAAVVIAGLIWLFFYIRKKKMMGESILPEEPPRPPREIAVEALRALEAEQLWQRGKVKDYHSQLSDIIRVYIEGITRVGAMELTTDEILSAGPIASLSGELTGMLREMLVRADLVKFAKFIPLPEENQSSFRMAFEFVDRTAAPAPPQTEAAVTTEAPA